MTAPTDDTVRDFDAFSRRVDESLADVVADMGEEFRDDPSVYADLVAAVAWEVEDDALVAEACGILLGFLPIDIARQRPEVARLYVEADEL